MTTTSYPSTTVPTTTPRSRAPLSALSKLEAALLVASSLSLIYLQAFIAGEVMPPLAIFAVLELIAALSIGWGRWRWTPALGVAIGTLILIGNAEGIQYDMSHPENLTLFTFIVVAVSLAVLDIGVGIAATVQNYMRAADQRPAPRGIATLLVGVAMLGVGAILIAAIPRTAGASVSPEVLAQLPTVTTPGFAFEMPDLRVHAGDTVALRLDNPTTVPHSFDIDALNVHASMTPGESGLALFQPLAPGSYTYYCSIPGHRELGMEGTLIVE